MKNPLFWLGKTETAICKECIKEAQACGRKLFVAVIENRDEIHTCGTCKRSARRAPFLDQASEDWNGPPDPKDIEHFDSILPTLR